MVYWGKTVHLYVYSRPLNELMEFAKEEVIQLPIPNSASGKVLGCVHAQRLVTHLFEQLLHPDSASKEGYPACSRTPTQQVAYGLQQPGLKHHAAELMYEARTGK